MQYTVTRQYTRDRETAFAQFADLSLAQFFIKAKLAKEERLNLQIIYRIYQADNLVATVNPVQGVTTTSHTDFNSPATLGAVFRVVENEKPLAEFKEIVDAELFAVAKWQPGSVIRIYDQDRVVGEVNQQTMDAEINSGGNEKKMVFRPTPLNTELRLGPHNWWREDDDEEDEK